jgi:hypothetical protein
VAPNLLLSTIFFFFSLIYVLFKLTRAISRLKKKNRRGKMIDRVIGGFIEGKVSKIIYYIIKIIQ